MRRKPNERGASEERNRNNKKRAQKFTTSSTRERKEFYDLKSKTKRARTIIKLNLCFFCVKEKDFLEISLNIASQAV